MVGNIEKHKLSSQILLTQQSTKRIQKIERNKITKNRNPHDIQIDR